MFHITNAHCTPRVRVCMYRTCTTSPCTGTEHLHMYRVAKRHKMPYLCKSLSAKKPYNLWLFGGKRLAIWGIL